MKQYTFNEVQAAMKAKKYKVFEDNLNVVGIRSSDIKINKFNDALAVFHKTGGQWQYAQYSITTLPGTAILKEGQYIDTHTRRKHSGKYFAMCTKDGVLFPVYRDTNKNKIPDFDPATIKEDGHNINIHRSNPDGCSISVGEWSAGCQVFQCGISFKAFMALVTEFAAKNGNSFSYTLLRGSDL